MSDAFTTTLQTEDGPFTVIMRDGAVLSSGWTGDPEELRMLIHSSLQPSTDELRLVAPEDEEVKEAVMAVKAYYEGDLDAVRRVPVVQRSGEFRSHAWEVLRNVEPGGPVTYSQYAQRAGSAAAVRAAAGACAMNAAALFVPCHRVVRTDGSLGGFRWGLKIKESLLKREAQNGV